MSHERGFRILKIQKTRFYLHGSSVFAFCYFLSFFCVFGRPFENSSFTCMGAQFWRTRSAILCFLSFLKTQKNTSGGFSGPLGSKTLQTTILAPFWRYFGPILQGLLGNHEACVCQRGGRQGRRLKVLLFKKFLIPISSVKIGDQVWGVDSQGNMGKGTALHGKKTKGKVAPACTEIQFL